LRWPSALVAALLAAGVVAAFAANVHRYAFLGDDSFISFRYAKHLAEGQGLVWNRGERVEGYTNFLWVLLMAGGIEAGLEPELASKALGIASGLGLLAAMAFFTARTTSWRNPVVWLAPGVLAVHRSFTAWCTGGLETMFFSLLVFLAFLAFLRERERRSAYPLGSSMLFALATLTRPEGALFALVTAAFFLGEIARRRRSLRAGLFWATPYVALVGAHLLWRHAYYGYWLPNTFTAKVPGAWWEQGFRYLSLFAGDYQIVWFLPLVAASVLLRRQLGAWLLFAQATAYGVYVAYIGGDRFEFRFLVPILPHLIWLMADGVHQLARLRIGPGRTRIPAVALAGVAALGLLLTTHLAPRRPEARRLRNRVAAHGVNTLAAIRVYANDRAREGRVLRRLSDEGVLPPDLVLCVGGAGAVPYYTDWTTVDRRGLNDLTIARRPLESRGIIAHERDAPYAYLLERKVVVFDVLNRLLYPSDREKRRRGTVVHDGHELPLKAVRVDGQYLIFATVQPDAELDRIFAGLAVLH
jgi:arabinofuranosyltransferase